MLCTNVMKLEEKEQMKHSFYQECNIRKQKAPIYENRCL